jgi:serpin B
MSSVIVPLANAGTSVLTEIESKDLIRQGAINAMTRLVLTNAIYFKADWLFPFEKKQHPGCSHSICQMANKFLCR